MADDTPQVSDGEKPHAQHHADDKDAIVAEVSTETVPRMTWHRFGSFLSMAFLFTGAQIPPYLYGSSYTHTACIRTTD